jgi:hypothetical protein
VEASVDQLPIPTSTTYAKQNPSPASPHDRRMLKFEPNVLDNRAITTLRTTLRLTACCERQAILCSCFRASARDCMDAFGLGCPPLLRPLEALQRLGERLTHVHQRGLLQSTSSKRRCVDGDTVSLSTSKPTHSLSMFRQVEQSMLHASPSSLTQHSLNHPFREGVAFAERLRYFFRQHIG